MSRYAGYQGRNVYRHEFYYTAMTVPQRLLVDLFAGAAAVLIPYVPRAVADPLLQAAGWDGDAGEWIRVWLGLREQTIELDGVEVEVYGYSARWAANFLIYQLDTESNVTEWVVGTYPGSTIPLNWRSNVWIPDIF